MKFSQKIEAILQALGLQEKAKNDNLSAAEWDKVSTRYAKKFGGNLYKDAKEAEEKSTKAQTRILALLKSAEKEEEEDDDEETKVAKEEEEEEDDDEETKVAEEEEEEDDDEETKVAEEDEEEKKVDKSTNAKVIKGVKKMLNENKSLRMQVKKMAGATQFDRPLDQVRPTGLSMKHTDAHLYGVQHSSFEMKHRWNRIAKSGITPQESSSRADFKAFQKHVSAYGESIAARIDVLHKVAKLNVKALTTDYADLIDAGLGDQFLVRRQDALIAQILELPTVFDIFPLRSNVQDEDLITNAFFGEFSQSYQPGEQSKGGMILQPEKAKVHDSMFKTLFESMKWIETQYIGYLNQNGSDPVKWSMIEWMVFEIAKVLTNEQNQRYVMGYRIEPVKGENAHFLYGSTGVIHRLLSYVEEHKVHPLLQEEFASYTASTIYDVVDAFVDEVNMILPNLNGKALYLNQKHRKWFAECYRERFGQHSDFTGTMFKLQDYEVPIIWVPNMGNYKFIWITELKNVQTLQNKPGEMLSVYFERRLESVWGLSVWKEGTGAAYSGRKFDTKQELVDNDYADQAIFINMPFTQVTADATTIDVKGNILFQTGINTKATALTDLANAKAGEIYKIEIGSIENPTSIAKTDKFINIKSAWNPTTEGAWIKLYLKDGLFYEADRSK